MGRLDRRKAKTKQLIVTTAMELIESYGFEGTTMEQIAEEADIAKGTLYNYFPVKEAILSEWIQRESLEKDRIRLRELPYMENTHARMAFIFRAYVERVAAQKDLFEKYLIYQMQQLISLNQQDTERSSLAIMGSEIIKLGQKSGELRRDIPTDVLDDMFEAVFIEIVKRYYKNPTTFQSEEWIEKMVDMFLHGVKNEPAADHATRVQ